jgi:hypothetical protein
MGGADPRSGAGTDPSGECDGGAPGVTATEVAGSTAVGAWPQAARAKSSGAISRARFFIASGEDNAKGRTPHSFSEVFVGVVHLRGLLRRWPRDRSC